MRAARREAFFLDAPGGARFCLATRPVGASCGALLFVPPFAEELNKSRRMVALGAAAFAARGWTVLQPDLLGCGDSAGDFGDACWNDWRDDVGRAWLWLRENAPGPVVLWTLRAGGLLAADWIDAAGERPGLMMWQPVTNGRQHFAQFLRLKAAGEMLADSDAKEAMARTRAELQAGQSVEVAGYRVSPRLAEGLDAAKLRLPAGWSEPTVLLEVSNAEHLAPSPALEVLAGRWQEARVPVAIEVLRGPAFWHTQEIEVAPALIERSLAILERMVR